MINLDEIKVKLRASGIDENSADKIIEDVMNLIAAATLKTYVSKLNDIQKDKLRSVPEAEFNKFIEEHKDDFPPMPQEEIDRIFKETWDSYFQVMAAN